MTNADATKQRAHAKKRQWRDGGAVGMRSPSHGGGAVDGGAASAASALLAKYRSFSSGAGGATARRPPSLVDVLPPETVAHVLAFLDGQSLLQCATTCRVMAAHSHSRDVWKNICVKTWPSLRAQILPQLPGAPDYDLIRLYGGSWRRCFLEQHRLNQRVSVRVELPHFGDSPPPSPPSASPDKVVSDTFWIGDHRFCLWIFPHGNPNEPLYVGRVLSVYLVLTDLDRRPPDWLTCAVFSLAVVNHASPQRTLEWHSCLADNKFDARLNNWGVHSLGALATLKDPSSGFLLDNALTVTASVRLMTITFRIIQAHHIVHHKGLGLVDFQRGENIQLPFCCTLGELLARLEQIIPGADKDTLRVWCFNQPIVSGQALRPRKRLTQQQQRKSDPSQPLFGNALCDGVDIDAYSFCQVYVERPGLDDAVLEVNDDRWMDVEMEEGSGGDGVPPPDYVFIKIMTPDTLELEFLGRYSVPSMATLTTSDLYACVAARLGCPVYDLAMFREEIAPTLFSAPLPWSEQPLATPLQPADVVIFTHAATVASGAFSAAMHRLLRSQYAAAEQLLQRDSMCPTLEHIETLAERLDIPKFRVRSAFRKCHEDGRLTLWYIMEGRHLGFICDSCGETDFKGPRFNCAVCSDYDLCGHCHAKCQDVNHRYANVDGKWQRVYEFKDHSVEHAMREMLPVFFDYERQPREVARAW